MIRIQSLTLFSGGSTVAGEKQGAAGSFLHDHAIEFRKKVNQISLLPGMRSIGKNTINDLITALEPLPDGRKIALGRDGYVYMIDTDLSVSELTKLSSGGGGIAVRQDVDKVIITSHQTASVYGPLSNFPKRAVPTPRKYGPSASTDKLASAKGGARILPLPNKVNETTGRCSFQPDIEPLYSIKVQVANKGTGDWNLVLHDDADTVLATAGLRNNQIPSDGYVEFQFITGTIRMLVKPNARTYHWHLYSSDGTGSIIGDSTTDFAKANYQILAERFVQAKNNLHIAINFLQYTCFTNERYLSVFEPLEDNPTNDEWQRHRLTFPPGYEGCGLALYSQYLAIACERRSDTGEIIDGLIFLWDGTSTTYNDVIHVPEGAPHGLANIGGSLYWVAANSLWGYSGAQPEKIKTFPGTDTTYTGQSSLATVGPAMLSTRDGVMMVGFPAKTTNPRIDYGVYSYGAIDRSYPNSFGFSYIPTDSSINYAFENQLELGLVRGFGDLLFLSSYNKSRKNPYALEVVDQNSAPASFGRLETLISDNGTAFKQKQAMTAFMTFKPLPENTSIALLIRLDRGPWEEIGRVATTNLTSLKVDLHNRPYFDYQLAVELRAGGKTPEILQLGLQYEDNSNEDRLL